MRPDYRFWITPNCPKVRKMTMKSQFFDITLSSIFFDVALFFLSSLVTGPVFIVILSLALEVGQFTFIRD